MVRITSSDNPAEWLLQVEQDTTHRPTLTVTAQQPNVCRCRDSETSLRPNMLNYFYVWLYITGKYQTSCNSLKYLNYCTN